MSTLEAREGVRHCSVARTLDVVGEKWSLLAVRELLLGSHRFAEIQRHTGAPRDVLTARLRGLEDAGIIERRRYQERPERFEYHLTELGETLSPVVAVLRQWGDDHLAGSAGPPATFLHSCGQPLEARVVCAHCGEPAASAATP